MGYLSSYVVFGTGTLHPRSSPSVSTEISREDASLWRIYLFVSCVTVALCYFFFLAPPTPPTPMWYWISFINVEVVRSWPPSWGWSHSAWLSLSILSLRTWLLVSEWVIQALEGFCIRMACRSLHASEGELSELYSHTGALTKKNLWLKGVKCRSAACGYSYHLL